MNDIERNAKGFIASNLPGLTIGLLIGIILGYCAGRLL